MLTFFKHLRYLDIIFIIIISYCMMFTHCYQMKRTKMRTSFSCHSIPGVGLRLRPVFVLLAKRLQLAMTHTLSAQPATADATSYFSKTKTSWHLWAEHKK